MKTTYPVAIMIATAALVLAPVPSLGQAPLLARSDDQVGDQAEAERAKRLARWFERNATQLTVFDREGQLITLIATPRQRIRPIRRSSWALSTASESSNASPTSWRRAPTSSSPNRFSTWRRSRASSRTPVRATSRSS